MERFQGERRQLTISLAKLQRRRLHGLCYFCNERYSLRYECSKEIHMILVGEEDGSEFNLLGGDRPMSSNTQGIINFIIRRISTTSSNIQS